MSAIGRIHEYLTRHTGETVFVSDMEQALDIPKHKILNGISYLRNHKGLRIDSIVAGHSYRSREIEPGFGAPDTIDYPTTPIGSSSKRSRPATITVSERVFEELTRAKDGALILRGSDDTIWRATEI